DCSGPRTGSSSAQTTSPRRSSPTEPAAVERYVPGTELIPVGRICAPERTSECLHALAALMRIEKSFDQACRGHAVLLCVAVDAIAQLHAHLDRRAHQASIP